MGIFELPFLHCQKQNDGWLPGNTATFMHHTDTNVCSYHLSVRILSLSLLLKMVVVDIGLSAVGRWW